MSSRIVDFGTRGVVSPRVSCSNASQPEYPAFTSLPMREHKPIDAAALWDIADQFALFGIRPAINLHMAGGGLDQPENSLDQGGLACAVRADDRHQHAGRHAEIDIPQYRLFAVGDGQVGNFNCGG